MTSSRWGTILPAKSSRELTAQLSKSLSLRMTQTGAAESLRLLYGIRAELDAELAVGRRIPEEIGKLMEEMDIIRLVDELKPIAARYSALITELFTMRPSVSTACTLARSFHEKLIRTACNHAVVILEEEGRKKPAPPWTVLVSGELGREESILGKNSSFFFIYRETPETPRDYFHELALRLMAILVICLPDISTKMNSSSTFWYGSDADWFASVAATCKGEKPDSRRTSSGITFPWMVETIADMRPVCGDPDLGESIKQAASTQLAGSVPSEHFRHLAKTIAVMPAPLGIFGRIKTARSGKNRGKFDLNEFALTPLTAAARILALSCGATEPSFTERMKGIVASGSIGVALADRLLIAYEDFRREMIRIELAGQQDGGRFFFNPDDMNEEARARFKSGLEDITTLQRLVYQQLVEVEPA